MLKQDQFRKAWDNFIYVTDYPHSRMKDLVKNQLGVEITITHAQQILLDSFPRIIHDDVIYRVSRMSDEEVLDLFVQFVGKYGT
jgi:hypothetical protein